MKRNDEFEHDFFIRLYMCRASLFLTIILSACNQPYQEVIEYFEKDGNPEKLEAAKFIIGNIQYQKHFDGDDYNKFLEKFSEVSQLPLWKRGDAINTGNLPKMLALKPDKGTVTSEFLIKHITLCHGIWDKTPWKNDYDFNYFCEYVLPYKSGYEAATLWIQEYHKHGRNTWKIFSFMEVTCTKRRTTKKNHMKCYQSMTLALTLCIKICKTEFRHILNIKKFGSFFYFADIRRKI